MQTIEVRVATSYWVRMAIVALPIMGVGPLILARGAERPGTSTGVTLIVGALAFMVVPVVLFLWSLRRWARVIDAAGVRRRDGLALPWADFEGVRVVRIRPTAGINHFELVFRGGAARVFPLVTDNRDEVMAFVHAVEAGQRPWLVPVAPAAPAAPVAPVAPVAPPRPPAPAPLAASHGEPAYGRWTLHGLALAAFPHPRAGAQAVVLVASWPGGPVAWTRELAENYLFAYGVRAWEEGAAIRVEVDGEHARGGNHLTWSFLVGIDGALLAPCTERAAP